MDSFFVMESIEIWKDIPNYEGMYQVSSIGRVKSLERHYVRNNMYKIKLKEKIIKVILGNKGYPIVGLHKEGVQKTFQVHLLMAFSFLNHKVKGKELVVNHKNIIRTDNRLENLEIITFRENTNKKHLKSTSKYTGVFWCKQKNKWKSGIQINGKNIHLGFFINEIDAHNAYQKKLYHINNKL